MGRTKIYNNKNEFNKARAEREKQKRRDDPVYARRYMLRNNFSAKVADAFMNSVECEICKTIREDHYNQIHHIIERKDGGTDELNNLIGVCYYCHNDIHTVSRGYAYIFNRYGWDINMIKKHRGLNALTI